jgi:uncharacterized protein (TIGR03437 family)
MGDSIAIYGTGFGRTSPHRLSGRIVEPAPLALPYVVRINGDRVTSNFGGIVGPGLYQFNLVVPRITGSFAFVEVEGSGKISDSNRIIAVQP